jgi:hypothetical protein
LGLGLKFSSKNSKNPKMFNRNSGILKYNQIFYWGSFLA